MDNIDEIIALIKGSKDTDTARQGLMERFSLSEKQANAILEMRLQRLTGLEREKIENEYNEIVALIADLEDILANESRIYQIIKDEQLEIKDKYGDDRRSVIGDPVHEMSMEDLIPNTQVAVLISKNGFVKRMPIDTFKSQNRGGRGIAGMSTRDEDSIEHLLITNTHDYLLCFTNKGRVFKIKSYQVPEASRQSKGVSLAHFLHFDEDEELTSIIDVQSFDTEEFLFMTTKKGVVKKTDIGAYVHFKNRPIAAINLDEGDRLQWVKKTTGKQDYFVTSAGMVIRFEEAQVTSQWVVHQEVLEVLKLENKMS